MGKSKQQARKFLRNSSFLIQKKISKSSSNDKEKLNQQSQTQEKKIEFEYGEIITLIKTNLQYKILNKIGEGGQSLIFMCQNIQQNHLQNSNQLVIKIFKHPEDLRYLETNGLIPKGENIIKYYEFDSIEKDQIIYTVVVMEKCEMTLRKYLLEKGKEQGKDDDYQGQLKKSEALKILKQILNGYMTFINYGIVHRDLKPSNILLKDEVWKIGDFGFARFQTEEQMTTNVGTHGYQSPQLQLGTRVKYTSKCDVYSLGIMFYEMLYGELPWPINSPRYSNLYVNFKKKKLGVQLKNFIKQCLEFREDKRLSWKQVYNYSIFRGEFQIYVKQLEIIEELNKLYKDVSSYISDEKKQEIIPNLKFISLEQFLDLFKGINKFSKMKLIIAYCLLKTQKINKQHLHQDQSFMEQMSQVQMAQNPHLACLLTFYLSQIYQPKEPTVFFNGKDISEENYVKILQKIDESFIKENAIDSFNLLKSNETILHQDFLDLFQFNFLQ